MVIEANGSIFNSRATTLVNPVNCVGVMGAGLAQLFKERYPENYRYYYRQCQQGLVQTGNLCIFEDHPLTLINFPTKYHWRYPSHLDFIQTGLEQLRIYLEDRCPHSIAIPALGCGLGELDYSDVKSLVVDSLSESYTLCYLFQPYNPSYHTQSK